MNTSLAKSFSSVINNYYSFPDEKRSQLHGTTIFIDVESFRFEIISGFFSLSDPSRGTVALCSNECLAGRWNRDIVTEDTIHAGTIVRSRGIASIPQIRNQQFVSENSSFSLNPSKIYVSHGYKRTKNLRRRIITKVNHLAV